jgi:uncharacterized protein (TIGR01777 family)
MSNRILITGASGLIATTLAKRLTELGFECVFLSANKRRKGEQNYFYWNISTGELDERCLDGVDSIVHLAGAGIADKAWTPAYKKEIVDSRSGATALLLEKVKQRGGRLRSFVSASGIGFYPSVDEALDEKAAHGSDFVANVCLQWETAANAFKSNADRVCCIRTALVLAKGKGFLQPFEKAMQLGVLPVFGDGNQLLSWIHIDDLVEIYVRALTDPNMQGAYNAATGQAVSQRRFNQSLATARGRKVLMPPLPAFAVRAIFGERAMLLLGSQNVVPAKLRAEGFVFQYPELLPALKQLYVQT